MFKNRTNNQILNNSVTVKEEHERMSPLHNEYGPKEKKGLSVMIPLSSIWRWLRKRCKN